MQAVYLQMIMKKNVAMGPKKTKPKQTQFYTPKGTEQKSDAKCLK
jgi:hypothetical protein